MRDKMGKALGVSMGRIVLAFVQGYKAHCHFEVSTSRQSAQLSHNK
jgi:hypothetical protein